MTFGLNDQYRQSMMERGARLDEFFDPFFGEDGSFDYDGLGYTDGRARQHRHHCACCVQQGSW